MTIQEPLSSNFKKKHPVGKKRLSQQHLPGQSLLAPKKVNLFLNTQCVSQIKLRSKLIITYEKNHRVTVVGAFKINANKTTSSSHLVTQ